MSWPALIVEKMRRIPQLDGLRGIAVLMVFVYHALHAPLLWAGVDLFFVLSGYLITGILLKLKEEHTAAGYWGTFYMRRFRRIVPPYVGLLLVISILFPVHWAHLWYWYTFFGANIAAAFGKCSVHAMGPLWSLAVEEQFYFLWPLFVWLCDRKVLKKLAIGIMVAAPVLRGICTLMLSTREPIYDLTPFRADLLACGALIAVCAAEDSAWIERRQRLALFSMIGAGALLIGLSAFRSFRLNANSEFFNVLGYSLIVILFGSVLVKTLGMNGGPAFNALNWRPLRYTGQISYTFYLYQVAVMDSLAQHIHSRLEIAIGGLLITTLISILSWHYLEQPILKLRLGPPSTTLQAGTA
jgi:peptidoglycan/LPS O-acetylase OafA/YrhL